CSASADVLVTVSPTSTTQVTPTTATVNCASNVYTLVASGANTYSWQPNTGLNAATGFSVIASPTVTTVYTVTGSDNCTTTTATTTLNVVTLITPTVFPVNTWNAYCYGDNTLTNYYGYYTENGSGASGYNFNTSTRFSSVTPIPSNANSSNGLPYTGCVLTATNWAISFKRTGFTCGTYSINVFHDDYFYLFINGIQVAQHVTGINDTHNGVWTGVLNTNSTVEFRLIQNTGNGAMSVTLAPVASATSQSTWIGATSSDWFTTSNWCSGVPNFSTNVVIPAAGPQYMPVIAGLGAECKTITISPAIVAGTYNTAIPAASLSISGANNLDIYGDWSNRGVFSSGSGTLNLTGSSNTTFSCPVTFTQTIYNLTVNKTGAVGVTTTGGVHTISNHLKFMNGIITQSSVLQVMNGATVTGQSNTSYVDGPIVKIGNSAFTFPVGTGGLYRPIGITAPTLVTDNFVAQYFIGDVDPTYSVSLKDPSLHHISRCEYWILNRALGTSNVSVTLTWDVNSCSVTVLPDLRVARWDAGQVKWKDQGNGGTSGNTTTGVLITSGPVTNFSPFTLASSSANNPLPIGLKYFYCTLSGNNYTELKWATATEINNDYFSVESSEDAVNFRVAGTVKGSGNSHQQVEYSFQDNTPFKDLLYYRLKQTDFDGKFTYSSICYVSNKAASEIDVYPNPASSEITIAYAANSETPVVIIKNILGQQIASTFIPQANKIVVNTSEFKDGVYLIEIVSGTQKIVTKIIVQH
ncbi:MAG: T9SS type A sorting domain-containing protein, partial [Bacteroidetes bacterium]|nr:T9SS type A sorting domain-containing protein [Bacteroidota bacterium]